MRLTRGIYCVGSAQMGLSHRFDCNVYLIDTGAGGGGSAGSGGLVLIDAGTGVASERILDNVRAEGLDPARIGCVLSACPCHPNFRMGGHMNSDGSRVFSRRVMDLARFDPAALSPGRHQLALAANIFERGSTREAGSGQALYLPALVVRGSAPAPLVVVTGGVHGDEYEGPEAIRRAWRELDPAALAGTFVGLPVANPMAYEAGARHTPREIDGVNLARCFPGKADGTPTLRLAEALFKLVLRADLLIDLHSGGSLFNFAPVAGCYDLEGPKGEAAERVARAFGLPVLWIIEPVAGTLSWEAARAGAVTVGCEYAGEARLAWPGVEAYARGIRAALAAMGMLGEAPPTPDAPPRKLRSHWQTAAHAGLFYAAVPLMAELREGQVIGRVFDEFGELHETIMATRGGVVLGIRTRPRVEAYDWAACLGVEG